ncbi:hypothetical protein D3C86_1133750 [compost metagenome]
MLDDVVVGLGRAEEGLDHAFAEIVGEQGGSDRRAVLAQGDLLAMVLVDRVEEVAEDVSALGMGLEEGAGRLLADAAIRIGAQAPHLGDGVVAGLAAHRHGDAHPGADLGVELAPGGGAREVLDRGHPLLGFREGVGGEATQGAQVVAVGLELGRIGQRSEALLGHGLDLDVEELNLVGDRGALGPEAIAQRLALLVFGVG